jgi:hypothetical protein
MNPTAEDQTVSPGIGPRSIASERPMDCDVATRTSRCRGLDIAMSSAQHRRQPPERGRCRRRYMPMCSNGLLRWGIRSDRSFHCSSVTSIPSDGMVKPPQGDSSDVSYSSLWKHPVDRGNLRARRYPNFQTSWALGLTQGSPIGRMPPFRMPNVELVSRGPPR